MMKINMIHLHMNMIIDKVDSDTHKDDSVTHDEDNCDNVGTPKDESR